VVPFYSALDILPKSVIEELKKKYGFYVWSRVDESYSCIRLVTSWATPGDAVNEFLADLKAISQ
jgi:threonine aldolase